MSEKDLDSSTNYYIEEEKAPYYIKQLEWGMAIGLQEVDNLHPSAYLEQLISKNIANEMTISEYENLLLGKNNNLHSKDLIVKELF